MRVFQILQRYNPEWSGGHVIFYERPLPPKGTDRANRLRDLPGGITETVARECRGRAAAEHCGWIEVPS